MIALGQNFDELGCEHFYSGYVLQEGIARYITSSKEHRELNVALVKATRNSDSKPPKRKFIDSTISLPVLS